MLDRLAERLVLADHALEPVDVAVCRHRIAVVEEPVVECYARVGVVERLDCPGDKRVLEAVGRQLRRGEEVGEAETLVVQVLCVQRAELADAVVVIAVSRQRLGVHERAVIALDEVLDHDLPVGGDRVLEAAAVDDAIGIDAGDAVEQLEERRQRRFERLAVGIGGGKEQRAERRDCDVWQAHLLVERHAGGAVERAIELVRPAVVAALQGAALAAALGDQRAAVAAHVRKAAQRAVVTARDYDREAAELAGSERPGLDNVGGRTDVLPAEAQDGRAVALERLRGRVPVGGERAGGHGRGLYTHAPSLRRTP